MVPYHEPICLCTSSNNRLYLKNQKSFSENQSTATAEANSVVEAAGLSLRDKRAEMYLFESGVGACAKVSLNLDGSRNEFPVK